MAPKRTFEEWKRLVDAKIEVICGLTSESLPDYDYQSAYKLGIAPSVTARKVILAAKNY